ncbi:Transcription elongation factor spt6 [Phlyctochytrium bullatum]|nr:Transcription elongation factor spt6 [Phlyctochytrium bullatum]
MLTEEDEAIQIRDMPERFQQLPYMRELSEFEYDQATEYIFSELDRKKINAQEHELKKGIRLVLKFFHENHFEVPFIVAHRKDRLAKAGLERANIWRIFDLDQKFQAIEARRQAVRATLSEIRKLSNEANADYYCEQTLKASRSIEGVNDVVAYLQLKYGMELHRVEESKRRELKRTYRRTAYEEGKLHGLAELVEKFNIDVKAFAMTLAKDTQEFVPIDVRERPLESAGRLVKEKFGYNTADRVLEAARRMAASELGVDPILRDFVRTVYSQDAFISCLPTEKGKRDIQPLHPFYPFKYLKARTVVKFQNSAMFLQMVAAEEQGLITLKIEINDVAFMNDVYKSITNTYTDEFAELWNSERKAIAEIAFREILLPLGAKHIRESLTAAATEWLGDHLRYLLEQKIDVSPYHRENRNSDDYDDETKSDYPRVMAISWGDGDRDSATFAVCLDEDGLVSERKKLSRMQLRDSKAEDHRIIAELIKDFQPEAIVVGGWSIETKTRLMPDLAGLLSDIDNEGNTDASYRDRRRRHFVKPDLFMVDDEVARLAMTSKRYAKEFPDPFPPLARYCVSLGRRVQDATLEYATLFNSDEEFKLLRLHNLQGLGGKLESRTDLITKKIVTSSVFMNCSSFIRIRRRHLYRDSAFDVLDDTRIHPEDYDLARKMAADALDIDEIPDSNDPSAHVAELMENDPEKLELLMLDEYGKELERRMDEPK